MINIEMCRGKQTRANYIISECNQMDPKIGI